MVKLTKSPLEKAETAFLASRLQIFCGVDIGEVWVCYVLPNAEERKLKMTSLALSVSPLKVLHLSVYITETMQRMLGALSKTRSLRIV